MSIIMNLGDPEFELIDPTPNIHALFLQFDQMFFWSKVSRRAVVRWSKRMYSSAGVCSYEGRGGLCDIALSEPLLKLRPRKDLVETLLHEMIHAFLFITCRDQDRDGHGPNFKEHMRRINDAAGLNITVYHSFHDEVQLYQTHWWRCNGPCQKWRPHFGIVRKSMNRAPSKFDYWWDDHNRRCGGTFVKIKEPEKVAKPTKSGKSKGTTTPNADILRYIENYKKVNNNNDPPKSILKDSNSNPNFVVSKKEPIFNPRCKSPVFEGRGKTIHAESKKPILLSVVEAVRNVWTNKEIPGIFSPDIVNEITETVRSVWANKQIGTVNNKNNVEGKKENNTKQKAILSNPKKHKIESDLKSPPAKVKKIDDYFKATATSVLKDLYGDDIRLEHGDGDGKKLIAISNQTNNSYVDSKNIDLVDCPICHSKVVSKDINNHLDECLNKEVIENICNEVKVEETGSTASHSTLPKIPAFQPKKEPSNVGRRESNTGEKTDNIVLQTKTEYVDVIEIIEKETKSWNSVHSDDTDVNLKEIERNSDNFVISKKEEDLKLDVKKSLGPLKAEPGTSAYAENTKCACCGNVIDTPLEQHLDECLAFLDNNTSIPEEGASTSAIETIVIDDDDDIFDESQTFNATGTKAPCPCCLQMVEEAEMNEHLDQCLS